jgi:hypothetical protein
MHEIKHRNSRKLVLRNTPGVYEHDDITVLWNQGVQTDAEVLNNRPDITIKNKT